jgi:hypothetical protein
MSGSSTARSHRFRQRRLCEWLVAGGVLSPLDTDQHEKVEQALGRAIALLIAGNNQPSFN